MNRLLMNRNNLVALLLAGIAFVWLATGSGKHSGGLRYQVPEVNLAQAKVLIDAGALVLDVRGSEQFAYRHIPGAMLLPLETLHVGIPASISAARDRPVVVYCNEGLAHGPEATHILQQAGFTKAVNLKSGIEGWASAALPLAKG